MSEFRYGDILEPVKEFSFGMRQTPYIMFICSADLPHNMIAVRLNDFAFSDPRLGPPERAGMIAKYWSRSGWRHADV